MAYVRLSGIERLGAALDSLLNRRGSIEGAVGIDDGITTVEALEAIRGLSKTSTIFHTVSGYIYHPKLYLITGENSAVAIVGSPHLTRDGLYRNVEFASAVHMDFTDSNDLVVFQRYDAFINEFLDISHPNVKPINSMFPKIAVPPPPPGYRPTIIKQIIVPPSLGVGISTFVM